MAGPHMPWFKFHSTAPDDEKVRALAGELGDPKADVYLYRLWAYCGRRKPSGRFAKATAVSVIEGSVGWAGERGRLVDVLLLVGLLDDVGEEYEVHKWPEYQTALVAKFEADKKRPPGRTRSKSVPPVSRAGFVESPARETSGTPRGVSPLSTLSSSEGVQGEDSEPGALMDRLHAAFFEVCGHAYAMDRRDEGALRVLLIKAGNDEAELLRRWRLALKRTRYPQVKALWELPNAWNHCATPEPEAPPGGRPKDVTRGVVRAEDAKHAAPGVIHDF